MTDTPDPSFPNRRSALKAGAAASSRGRRSPRTYNSVGSLTREWRPWVGIPRRSSTD
jgi:hypothetical protein